MKVKFLRDYHGPETNEYRHLQGAEVELADAIALDFMVRKIVVSIEPAEFEAPVIVSPPEEVVVFSVDEPIKEVIAPKVIVKRKKKK